MRLEGVTRVEQRLDLVLAPERYGVTVKEACQLWGVSRETFYVWRRRYEREGLGGLEDRSSRPARSPGRMAPDLENRIVDMRRAHPRWGARRIGAELRRQGRQSPARSSIERVLVRNGLLNPPAPAASPLQRFVREHPNELWQIDAKEWPLTNGTVAQIISCIDDHSRYCPASRAFAELSTQAAIATFDEAAGELGLPESVLSDRGTVFTARRTNGVGAFERHVWGFGIYTINGRAYHPQTQGKVERFHRTMGEWLADNGPFSTLRALNRSLDEFRHDYNHDRPHQSLADATPAEVWAATPPARPRPELAAERCRRESLHPTWPNGNLTYSVWVIGVGKEWASTKVRVIDLGHVIEIRDAAGELIRDVKPDYAKRYLGSGRPGGRRARPPSIT